MREFYFVLSFVGVLAILGKLLWIMFARWDEQDRRRKDSIRLYDRSGREVGRVTDLFRQGEYPLKVDTVPVLITEQWWTVDGYFSMERYQAPPPPLLAVRYRDLTQYEISSYWAALEYEIRRRIA